MRKKRHRPVHCRGAHHRTPEGRRPDARGAGRKIGPYGFDIEVFNITSFEFSEEFNAAIEAKQTAQQNALKAEQDLARIKVEAQQQIEQAVPRPRATG